MNIAKTIAMRAFLDQCPNEVLELNPYRDVWREKFLRKIPFWTMTGQR